MISSCMSRSKHHEAQVISRILFVFAKLNAGIGYVQGMNEVISPLYYTMARDQGQAGTC